jgi:hypothetical protein|tara:strand:+ start:1849 stop:3096 length:1248 start_codon:yes stop_codon:yes gene_type:complete
VARETTFDYKVTVVDSGGNKYAIDGNTQQYVILFPGGTYKFDQADSTNGGHPLRFSETSNGSHGGGSEYTTGVTTAGTPGSSGAYTQIEVTTSTPFLLYYYCTQHSGMGGAVNIPNNIPAAGSGDLGVFMGGSTPSNSNVIDFVNISVNSDATDFGDLTGSQQAAAALCDGVSAYYAAGGGDYDGVQIINLATRGNAASSTNLPTSKYGRGPGQNQISGVLAGGAPSASNVIDVFNFKTTAAGSDFGDLTAGRFGAGGCSSPTRALFVGGEGSGGSSDRKNIIDYVTIASKGNAVDFGDYSQSAEFVTAASSSTRGLMAGGQGNSPGPYNDDIRYVTISSTGNSTDFGNLVAAKGGMGGVTNNTKCIFGGGSNPSQFAVIDVVTIASTGDAADFGDLTVARSRVNATGNGIGGLQ